MLAFVVARSRLAASFVRTVEGTVIRVHPAGVTARLQACQNGCMKSDYRQDRSPMKPGTGFLLAITVLLLAAAGCKESVIDLTGKWKVTTLNATVQQVAEGTTAVTGPEGSNLQTLHQGSKLQTVREETLDLRMEGGKLAGTVGRLGKVNGKAVVREQPIEATTFQGNEISFVVTFPPSAGQGPGATTKYQGTFSGGKMRGTLESEWMGVTIKRDWEANRVTE